MLNIISEDDVVLDVFHYHEALDRVHVSLNNWLDNVESHWVMPENEDLREKAKEISDLMSDLYQAIALRSDEKFKE